MKYQLEASKGVSYSPASSSAPSEVSPSVLAPLRPQDMPSSPRPHKDTGNARGPIRPSPPPQPPLAHDNRFSALSSPPTPTPASRPPSPAPAPRASSQDSVIGSSIVRHVGVNGASGNATVACFPGARVRVKVGHSQVSPHRAQHPKRLRDRGHPCGDQRHLCPAE
ncbi:hypothetical protein NFI96_004975 [Prochilodus magdalenae]|nr:hypothetical protein NFI96_004975 [Prochilodus magdalenae]